MGKCGPAVKYVVRLDAEERQQLEGIIRTGRGAAYRLLKARILLKADVSTQDCGWDDAQIAEALETSLSTVYRTRRQLVEEGLEAALARKTRSTPQPRIFDGEKEAKLIALACSEPPKGYARWSLRLLEKRVPTESVRLEANALHQQIDPLVCGEGAPDFAVMVIVDLGDLDGLDRLKDPGRDTRILRELILHIGDAPDPGDQQLGVSSSASSPPSDQRSYQR